jgi:hypothetical protein
MLIHSSLRQALGTLMMVLASAAAAQDAKEVTVKAKASVELERARCIVQPINSPGAVVSSDAQGMMYLHFTPPQGQTDPVTVMAQVGPALVAGACAPAAERRYLVRIDSDPNIPQAALGEAFRILVAAFVLAVLLESAFELLFNWRLFQEYFVGKAWRTPIMFAISLLVVDQFDFDPLAQVFSAYQGGAPQDTDDWLTLNLSAMILAGGSVGVNRIMTSLGIRSPFPKIEQERARLSDQEAYLSVTVRAKDGANQFAVNMSESAADPGTPQVLGIIGGNGEGRLRNLFFPTSLRIPRSGGMRVAVDTAYRITVTDLRTGAVFDIYGKPASVAAAPLLRFAPRAFVDIVIVLADPAKS